MVGRERSLRRSDYRRSDPRGMVPVRRTGSNVAAAFWTSLSGLYMRSQGQQIHLEVSDETVFELFERAVSFKRLLARIIRGGEAAKAVEWPTH
jgi:hypothetical protein